MRFLTDIFLSLVKCVWPTSQLSQLSDHSVRKRGPVSTYSLPFPHRPTHLQPPPPPQPFPLHPILEVLQTEPPDLWDFTF